MKIGKVIFLVLFFSFSKHGIAQLPASGTFDQSFGSNGKILINSPHYYGGYSDICVQTDNKILLCGISDSANLKKIYITRLNSDGSIDINFGQLGVFLKRIQHSSEAFAIALQPDGKILITGDVLSAPPSSKQNMFVMRLLSNGTIDNTFGNAGVFIANIATPLSKYNIGYCIKLASDGSILVGGDIAYGSGNNPGLSLFKVTANGHLDTQFGISGYRTFTLSFWDYIRSMDVQPDGKILLAGGTFSPFFTYIMRFNSNGSVDSSFATNGIFTKSFSNEVQYCNSILITKNKKIVCAGSFKLNSLVDSYIYRLDSTGTLDLTFGINGIALFDTGIDEYAFTITETTNRNLIIGGHINPLNGYNDIFLAGFDSTGTIDLNFATNGQLIFDVNSSNDILYCSKLQPDGKLLIAGHSDSSFLAARFFTSDYTGSNKNTIKKNTTKLFPNPASDQLTISADDELKNYDLFDVKGVSIKHLTSYQNSILNTSKLLEGIYYLKVFLKEDTFEILKIQITR